MEGWFRLEEENGTEQGGIIDRGRSWQRRRKGQGSQGASSLLKAYYEPTVFLILQASLQRGSLSISRLCDVAVMHSLQNLSGLT